MKPRYDLLAIDLDGTLLDPGGSVPHANVEAIRAARAAGMAVTICTGRGFVECREIAERIEQRGSVVVAGGAIVACGVSGATEHRFPMDLALVGEIVECLNRHGHAALVLKDPSATAPAAGEPGHDYVVVSPRGRDGIDPISRWWFDALGVKIRVVPSLDADGHPEHTVRVGLCGSVQETQAAADEVRARFGPRVTLHHFGAVVPSMGGPGGSEGQEIIILEAFDRKVNKWTAISWLAERDGIDPARIAAIGNDVNDVAMLKGAGLGIAMANAVPEAMAVATHVTLDNRSAGVAAAIEKIVRGEW
jgi:5-amino-6-(5-phospho-D-ribitylamino)uracil phosphatase